nr:MAG TPA: hypothetical protein [Bacteriophage sp.]
MINFKTLVIILMNMDIKDLVLYLNKKYYKM